MDESAADAETLADLMRGGRPLVSGAFGAVNCEPGWSWQFSGIGDYDVWAVTAGSGVAVVDDERTALAPGTVLLLRPDSTGAAEQDPGDRLSVCYAHFVFETTARSPSIGPEAVVRRALPPRISRLPPGHEVLSLLRTLTDPGDDGPLVGAYRSALLQLVLIELWRAGPTTTRRRDPRIAGLVAAIRQEPGRRWSLAQAAAHTHLSRPRLSRLFTAEVGTSFRAFCLQVRLDRARQLLLESPMSVTQVARALGYPDVYLFSRQVKERFGVPASVIRRTGHPR